MNDWSKRQRESGHGGLPNLGFGGSLVTIFISSYFAALIGNALLVIIFYGWDGYFVRGLRVTDWKHGILSNGAPMPFTGPVTFVLWIPLIFCAEIATGYITSFLRTKPRWLTAVAEVVCGAMLLLFWRQLWWHDHFMLIHPIPLAALIGGAAMVWKALRSAISA
jgi:hypothetical protein